MNKKIILTSKGFSLVEIMIVMAIMSVMGLGIANLMQNQMKASVYLDDKASYRDLKVELNRLMSLDGICTAALLGKRFPSVVNDVQTYASVNFLDSSGNPLFPNSKYDQLLMSKFKIKNLDLASPSTTGNAELIITLDRIRSGSNSTLKPMKFPIQVELDGSGNVLSCLGNASVGDGGCLRVVASYDLPNPVSSGFDHMNLFDLPPRRVPANIDAIAVKIRGNSTHYESSDDTHYNCSSTSALVTMKLDSIPTNRFKAGHNLKWVSNKSLYRRRDAASDRFANLVYYNGVQIGTERFCTDPRISSPNRSGTAFYQRTLDVCSSPSDPPQRDITFYRYHKNL